MPQSIHDIWELFRTRFGRITDILNGRPIKHLAHIHSPTTSTAGDRGRRLGDVLNATAAAASAHQTTTGPSFLLPSLPYLRYYEAYPKLRRRCLPSGRQAMQAAEAALDGGVSVLEMMMSTPGVFEVVQRLVYNHPTSTIGVVTVLNVEDAKRAIEAGNFGLCS